MTFPRCPKCGAAGRRQRSLMDGSLAITGAWECRAEPMAHRWLASGADQVAELHERGAALAEQVQRLAADVRRITGLRDTPLDDALDHLRHFRFTKLNARSPRSCGVSVSEGSAP